MKQDKQATIDLYSFDLFDTLVTRRVKRPTMIFDLIQHRVSISYRFPLINLIGFRHLRKFAERLTRLRSENEDITIFEIYRTLAFIIRNPAEVLKTELNTELLMIYAVEQNRRRLIELLKHGKECCIVSDMYLPLPFIKRLVRNHVDPRLATKERIFLSSHLKVTKGSGNLFKELSRIFGVSFDRIHHTGDNPIADVMIPTQLGMSTTHYVTPKPAKFSGSIYSVFKPENSLICPLEELGYEVVGPTATLFAKFIAEQATKDKIDKVFFGARDGYLIKEAFERITDGFITKYLRISRRSLYLPDYAVTKDETRFFEGNLSAADFFARLDMTTPEYLTDTIPARKKKEFMLEARNQGLDQLSTDELNTIVEYLRHQGFDGTLGFVDLGWRGSLQDSLENITASSSDIKGYYFGLYNKSPNKCAFYFQHKKPYSRLSLIFPNRALFEFLFTEPAPSLKRVSKNINDYEYIWLEDETAAQIEARNSIAIGCRKYFDHIFRVPELVHAESHIAAAALDRIYKAWLRDPSEELMHDLESFIHSKGFGGSEIQPLLDTGDTNFATYISAFWPSAYAKRAQGCKAGAIRLFHSVLFSTTGIFLLFHLKPILGKTLYAQKRSANRLKP